VQVQSQKATSHAVTAVGSIGIYLRCLHACSWQSCWVLHPVIALSTASAQPAPSTLSACNMMRGTHRWGGRSNGHLVLG
jgi:hypothetical protein